MTVAGEMLESYPADLGGIDREKLRACIEACVACAQACTACADACLAEEIVTDLRRCMRSTLACRDVCSATGRVLSRHTGYDASLSCTVAEACGCWCRTCCEECDRHA